jgi:toxin-antitoxin system PIN domain toxin
MPALCDVNLLLALCYDRHSHHRPALAWLDMQGARSAVLCRMTQLSLLRLLCHRAVMEDNVCTLPQAWAVYDQVQADERFVFYAEPADLEPALRVLTQANTPSPRLWQDAYLAAFALASGIRLATFDRDFRQFAELQTILLPQ